MKSMAEVIAKHQHAPSAKFPHRGGQSFVEYAKCGCGVEMSPWEHDKHLADILVAEGYGKEEA